MATLCRLFYLLNIVENSVVYILKSFYKLHGNDSNIAVDNEASLGEGFTPLVESKKLAEELGINKLYFKMKLKILHGPLRIETP